MKKAKILFFLIFLATSCYKAGPYVPTINDSFIEGDVGFLFFGDWGTGEATQKRVANEMQNYCKKRLCQFVVNLGDNFYPAGVRDTEDRKWKTHFLDVYEKLNLVFFSVLGNHDHDGNIQAQFDYTKKSDLWHLPSPGYYQFTKRNIDFFALDTDSRGYNQVQRDWLEQSLSKSKAQWKIVFGHHPVYSYGQHGATKALLKTLLPILNKYQVDFYLAGHEHDKQVLSSNSILYAISGTPAQTRPVKKGELSLFAASTLGFMHLKFREGQAQLSVLDERGNSEFEKSITKKAEK